MRLKAIVLMAMAAMMIGGVSLLGGCEKEPETPGQALDRAIENTGEAIEDAGDAIEDATD